MIIKNREIEIKNIEGISKRMKYHLLDTALAAGASSSHFGGGLSIIDITATLYGAIMKIDSNNPEWCDRDRFILSKGHGVLGYYTALVEAGFIPKEDLMSFEKNRFLPLGHPVKNRAKGIEFSNGSLGMGLALGIGVALSGKRRKSAFDVFVLMGDGECNEGAVWEAALAGPQYKLDNLFAIVDRNNYQQTGFNADIMSVGDLESKWKSFGWHVKSVDGHNVEELYDAFTAEKKQNKPIAIIAHTIKGKGFSFSENNNDWHHAPLTKSLYEVAINELNL